MLLSFIKLAEWQLSAVEIGWMEISPGGNFLGGNYPSGKFPGGNFLGGRFPGSELSRWDVSWVGIFFGGSFPGGNCPVGIIRVAVFLVPRKWMENSIYLHIILRGILKPRMNFQLTNTSDYNYQKTWNHSQKYILSEKCPNTNIRTRKNPYLDTSRSDIQDPVKYLWWSFLGKIVNS